MACLLTVTAGAFPFGVLCSNCRREIKPGSVYRNRNSVTGRLTATMTGATYRDDTVDVVVCGSC